MKKTIKVCDFCHTPVPSQREGMEFTGALLDPNTGGYMTLSQSEGISAGKEMPLRDAKDTKDPITLCWPCFDRAYGRSRPGIRGEG